MSVSVGRRLTRARCQGRDLRSRPEVRDLPRPSGAFLMRASRSVSWRTQRCPTCQARCHAGRRRFPVPACGHSWPGPPSEAGSHAQHGTGNLAPQPGAWRLCTACTGSRWHAGPPRSGGYLRPASGPISAARTRSSSVMNWEVFLSPARTRCRERPPEHQREPADRHPARRASWRALPTRMRLCAGLHVANDDDDPRSQPCRSYQGHADDYRRLRAGPPALAAARR